MAGTGAIMAGMAFVKLTLDDAQLQQGVKTAQGRIKGLVASVKTFASQMTTIAPLFSAPFVMAAKAFADFDDKMRLTAAVTGATASEFAALTEQAKKLGRETSYTAAQVAEGMTALGRMGFNPAEIQASIQPMMNLAKATGTDLATASEIAANNLRVFKMETSQASEGADILTATANSSAQTLTDLGEALKMAGPHAARAGANLKETAGMLGILANMGIRGSLAGTALGKSFKRMADPKVQAFLKEYGIETTTITGDLRKMQDILVDVAKAMKNMTNAEQINFAEEVFDARGSLGGGTLSVNTDAIDAMLQKLENCQGVAQQTSDQMEAGLGGTLRRMASAAEGVSLAIGEIIALSFGPVIESASSFCLMIREIIGANSDLLKGFLAITGGFVAFGAGIKILSMVGAGFKAILSPILALDKLLSGQTAKATEAAKAESIKLAATKSRIAQEIALEKQKTASDLADSAQRSAATAQEQAQKLAALQAQAAANQSVIAESTKQIAAKQAETTAFVAAEQQKIASLMATGTASQQQIAVIQAGITAKDSECAAFVAAEAEKQAGINATNLQVTRQITAQKSIAAAAAATAKTQAANAATAATQYQAAAAAARTAATAENTLTAAKSLAMKKDMARGAIIASLLTKKGLSIALHQREAAVIMATSIKSIVAAKASAGASALKTAGYYAEAVGAKVAAAATIGLNAALSFLAAHPVLAVLAALVVTYKILDSVSQRAAETAEKECRVHSRLADEAKQAREKMESEIKTSQTMIQKLVDLEKQGKLTAAQQLQAQTIVDELTKKYGDLGIQIDETTGQILGAAAAQDKLNAKQREALIERLQAEADENQASADALRRSFNAKFDWKDKLATGLGMDKDFNLLIELGFSKWRGNWNLTDEDEVANMERMKQALIYAQDNGMDEAAAKIKEIIENLKKAQAAKERLAAIREGKSLVPETAEEATAAEEAKKAAVQDLKKAEEELAKMDEDNAKKKMSQLEQEIAEIDKLKSRYMELAGMKLEALKAEQKKQQDLAKKNQAGSNPAERAAYRAAVEAAQQAQAQIDDLEKRIEQTGKDYDQQRADAEKKDQDRQKKDAAAREKQEKPFVDFLQNQDQKEQKRQQEKAQDNSFSDLLKRSKTETPDQKSATGSATEQLNAFLKALDGDLEAARQRYTDILAKYQQEGSEGGSSLSESERADLSGIQREIEERAAKLAGYKDQVTAAVDNTANPQKQMANVAGFNMDAILAQTFKGEQGKDAQIADQTKRTADNIEKTNRILSNTGKLCFA